MGMLTPKTRVLHRSAEQIFQLYTGIRRWNLGSEGFGGMDNGPF